MNNQDDQEEEPLSAYDPQVLAAARAGSAAADMAEAYSSGYKYPSGSHLGWGVLFMLATVGSFFGSNFHDNYSWFDAAGLWWAFLGAVLWFVLFHLPLKRFYIPEGKVGVTNYWLSPINARTLIKQNWFESGWGAKVFLPGTSWVGFGTATGLAPQFESSGNEPNYCVANVWGVVKPEGQFTGRYKVLFKYWEDLSLFLKEGQVGLQDQLFEAGKPYRAIHPVAFTAVNKKQVWGFMLDSSKRRKQEMGTLSYSDFDFSNEDVTAPVIAADEQGIVTCLDGKPPENHVVNRVGGWESFITLRNSLLGGTREVVNPEWRPKWDNRKVVFGNIFRFGLQKSQQVSAAMAKVFFKTHLSEHKAYQDMPKFWELFPDSGRGPHFDTLTPGRYPQLNRKLFNVVIASQVRIVSGKSAFLSCYDGATAEDITIPEFNYDLLTWPGMRGVPFITLTTDIKFLNTEFFQPVIVDTIPLIYFFYLAKTAPHGLDVSWDYITTITKDGVPVNLNLDVQVSIPQDYVSVFGVCFGAVGTMLQFSDNYLRPKTSALAVEVMNQVEVEPFLRNRLEAQNKLEGTIAIVLAEVFVRLDHVLIQEPSGEAVTRLLGIFSELVAANQSIPLVKAQKDLAVETKELKTSEAERDNAYKIASAGALEQIIKMQTAAIGPLLELYKTPEVVASKSAQKSVAHSILLMLLQPIVGEQAGALATAFAFADSEQKWVSEVMVGAQSGGDITSVLTAVLGKLMTQNPGTVPSNLQSLVSVKS